MIDVYNKVHPEYGVIILIIEEHFISLYYLYGYYFPFPLAKRHRGV